MTEERSPSTVQSSTPAPWGMHDTHDNTTEINSPLFDDPYHCIANVNARWGWNGDGTDPVQIANARLIAAAPALRDALQEIDSLASTGICVIGHKGKDRYIRLIANVAHRALLAAAAPPDTTEGGHGC